MFSVNRIVIALLIVSHAFWFTDLYAKSGIESFTQSVISGSYDLTVRAYPSGSIYVTDCAIDVEEVDSNGDR